MESLGTGARGGERKRNDEGKFLNKRLQNSFFIRINVKKVTFYC